MLHKYHMGTKLYARNTKKHNKNITFTYLMLKFTIVMRYCNA